MRIKFSQWSSLAKGEMVAAGAVGLLAILMSVSALGSLWFKLNCRSTMSNMVQGQKKTTIAGLTRCLEADAQNLPARAMKAALNLEVQDFTDARNDYERLKSCSEAYYQGTGHLGLGLIKMEEAAKRGDAYRPEAAREAEKDFRRAIDLAPDLGDAHLALATALLWNRDFVEAAKSIKRAFDTRNIGYAALPHLYNCRAVALAMTASAADARRAADAVTALGLKLSPTQAALTKQAQEDFDTASKLLPTWDDPRMNYAICGMMGAQSGEQKVAREEIERLIHHIRLRLASTPAAEQPRLFAFIAAQEYLGGNGPSAQIDFDRAFRAEPNEPAYAIGKAAAMLLQAPKTKGTARQGFERSALELIEGALGKKGLTAYQVFSCYLRAASLQARLDDYAKAAEALKMAEDVMASLREEKPTDRDTAAMEMVRGSLALKALDTKAAYEHFERAAAALPDNTELQAALKLMQVKPSIGEMTFVDGPSPADPLPVVRIRDVKVLSCARQLTDKDVTVTFNDADGLCQIASAGVVGQAAAGPRDGAVAHGAVAHDLASSHQAKVSIDHRRRP